MANTVSETLYKDLFILENEDNPHGSSVKKVYPPTTIDQVFDDQDVLKPTLRQLLEALREEIITGGIGNIVFPVTSVNGEQGDVNVTIESLGLGDLDLTKDIDKPLSNPQREAIMEILSNYHFDIDWSVLNEHIANTNNPHAVTFDQINREGAVDDLISEYMTRHNNSTSEDTHRDLRNKINHINDVLVSTNQMIENRIAQVLNQLTPHISDSAAHSELFDEKEDVSNKSKSFDTYDHTTYPTTRAVAEYVIDKIRDAVEDIDEPDNWIDDIQVIDKKSEIPNASATYYRKAYFIIHGDGFLNEVAICRLNDGVFSWEYHSLGSYTSFDSTYFTESPDGLSLNPHALSRAVLNDESVVEMFKEMFDETIPTMMSRYYTKDEIDSHHFVESIHILTGTQDGMIRYYINNDRTTMSEDIKVAGLKKLAFLDKVTENEIETNAIAGSNIANRAIEYRHITDKAVAAHNMRATYMTMFANVNDSEGNRVDEVTIDEMAELFGPKFKEIFESSTIYQDFEKSARRFAREEIHIYHGWPYPELTANFIYEDGVLKLYADDDAGTDVNLYLNSADELIAEYNEDDPIAEVLDRTSFQIVSDDLYMIMA